MPAFFGADKVAHLAAYSAGAVVFSWAIAGTWPHRFTKFHQVLLCTVVFALLFGICDEFHQSFVPDRSVSPWDVAADTLGGVLGTGFYLGILKGKNR